MPNRKQTTTRRDAGEINGLAPIELVRQHADAMLRVAMECCRLHDRFAKLLGKSPVDGEEHAADEACRACEESLAAMVSAYERTASTVHPERDEAWWHRANSLWMASREYARRNAGCDAATRRLAHHAPADLTKLHTEFELHASALLALRQACENYRRARPDAA